MSLRKSDRVTVTSLLARLAWITAAFAAMLMGSAMRAVAQGSPAIQWTTSPVSTPGAVAASPDGKLLAIGGYSSQVVLVNASTGASVRALNTLSYPAASIAFSMDSKTIAVGGMYTDPDGDIFPTLELFNASTGALISTLKTSANYWVSQVAFSSDGVTLAVGGVSSTAGVVELWNYTTQKLIAKLATTATWGVNSVAFSSDGKTLVVGGASQDSFGNLTGGVVEIWNPATAKLTKSIKTAANFQTLSVAVSSNGSLVIDCGQSLDSSGNATIVFESANVSSGAVKQLATGIDAEAYQVAYSPDGTMLAIAGASYNSSGNQYARVEWWSASTLKLLKSYLPASGAYAAGVTFSPNSKSVIYCGVVYLGPNQIPIGQAELLNPSSGSSTLSINTSPPGSVTALAASSDGKTLAIAPGFYDYSENFTQVLELVSAANGQVIRTLATGAQSGITSLAFSPDGTKLAVLGANASGSGIVEIWSITSTSAKLTSTIASSTGTGATQIAFSPNGALVADVGTGASGNAVIEVWTVSTAKSAVTLKTKANQALYAVAFSPDGKTLVAGGTTYNSQLQINNSTLEMWTVATGASVKAPPTNIGFSVNSLAYSPDGKTLAVGGTTSGGVIEFWTIATLKLVNTPQLPVTAGVINSIAYTPGGSTVLIGTDQALVGLHTANYGLAGYYVQNTENGVYSLYLAPGGAAFGFYRGDGSVLAGANPWTN